MHEGPTLLPANPLGGGEGCRHVGHHDELGPIAARLLDPGGIGAGHHNHFGMRAELARRPGGRNGVVAGADRGNAAGQLIWRQAEHDGQCAPRALKDPVYWKSSSSRFSIVRGGSRARISDLPSRRRAADRSTGNLPRRSDLGQGRGRHSVMVHRLCSVDGTRFSQVCRSSTGRADAHLSRRHGAAAARLGRRRPDRGRAVGTSPRF